MFENSAYLSRILKVIKPSLDVTPYYNEDQRPNSTSQTEELTRVNTSVTTLSDGGVAGATATAAAIAASALENSDASSMQCEVHASIGEDSDGSSSSSGLSDSSSENEDGAVPAKSSNNHSSSNSSNSNGIGGSEKQPKIVTLSVEAIAANNRQLSPRTSKELVLKFPSSIHASVSKCLSMDEDSVLSTATDIIATPQQQQQPQQQQPPATAVAPRASPVEAARFLRELFFLSKSLTMEKR